MLTRNRSQEEWAREAGTGPSPQGLRAGRDRTNEGLVRMKRQWDAIAWWEKRRIPFNLIVLVAGVASVLVIELVGERFVSPGEDVAEPPAMLLGVIVYAVAANLCYSLGWVTELLWSWGDTSRTETLRRRIFHLGTIFAVVLTLLPGILIQLAWAIWEFNHAP
jgi:hypothetical protein